MFEKNRETVVNDEWLLFVNRINLNRERLILTENSLAFHRR